MILRNHDVEQFHIKVTNKNINFLVYNRLPTLNLITIHMIEIFVSTFTGIT